MEVFIRNIPPQASDQLIHRSIKQASLWLSTTTTHVERRGKTAAVLLFLHEYDGITFLATYGEGAVPRVHLRILGSLVYCSRGRNIPDSVGASLHYSYRWDPS